eukprot:5961086-Prymnesium_polylepis.2
MHWPQDANFPMVTHPQRAKITELRRALLHSRTRLPRIQLPREPRREAPLTSVLLAHAAALGGPSCFCAR